MYARLTPLLFVGFGLVCAIPLAAGDSDTPQAAKEYTVTIYQLWGSSKPPTEKPPKALAAILKKLRKQSKQKSFRLADKPIVRTAAIGGKPLTIKLPQGYSASWTMEKRTVKGKAKVGVRQELTNPKKKKAVLFLGKCPMVTELSRIQEDGDTFVLYVDFKPGAKPKK